MSMITRRILLPVLALVLCLSAASQATANDGLGYSGFPFGFGFYQPYGIRYSTSVRTPPYFAVNPPVYYGQRHYRPYGASPFASLPLVEAGPGYRTRAAGEQSLPSLSVPHPASATLNPFCLNQEANAEGPKLVSFDKLETIATRERTNPFVGSQVASEVDGALNSVASGR